MSPDPFDPNNLNSSSFHSSSFNSSSAPNRADSLSPQQLQFFTAGLVGLPPDEIRKAKSLYLRNAISEYKHIKQSMQAFGVLQIFFAIIPCFWPILIMQRAAMNSATGLYRERINNTLMVWRDDLGPELGEIQQLFSAIESS